MKAEELAELYALCFHDDARPWSAESFQSARSDPNNQIYLDENAVLITRIVLDEAEILTLFVHPRARGRGRAASLLQQCFADIQNKGARKLHLDVAADNQAAIALYQKLGFEQVGIRKNYYQRKDGKRVNALLFTKYFHIPTN